ncbi:hypothetical protein, partial [Streptomyces sp. 039-1]|uniref:hypothetical protein n=1 Tax=Streptomyces sp. 039-1 TaxID=2789263 RepID=UPI0039F54E29
GFFFEFAPYWTAPGKIGNRFVNRPDRHPYDSGIQLQQGVNCEFGDISVDGTGLAAWAFAVGATDGTASVTPYAQMSNPALVAQMPTVNIVMTENSTKDNGTLQYKCRTALAFGSRPVVLPKAETYPGMYSPLQLKPGMFATVTTDDGFLNLINEQYVITQTGVTVGPDGVDRVSLSLVQIALFKETEIG